MNKNLPRQKFLKLLCFHKQIKYKVLLLFFVLISVPCTKNIYCQAGNRQITGTVLAAENNSAIPGANIIIKGSNEGTTTDVDGKFSISAKEEDILIFSFLGYVSQEIPVAGQSVIDVVLNEEFKSLDEVVVTGYASMKRSDLSSAQVSVDADAIQKSKASTVEQVLQGRAAGVYVTQNTGQPGGAISVNVRGINSISSSTEPMYVIDGVQILGSTVNNTSNPLSSINPDDIESLQVLLGPSVTSQYGSRASNGVIVITTKKGQAGEAKITYNGSFSIQEQPPLWPTMNLREYAEFQNELALAQGTGVDGSLLDPSVLGEGTNWQDELFSSAPIQKHELSLSGGNDNTKYFMSAEYYNHEGTALGSGFKRYSVRLNLDNKPRKWLNIGMNTYFSQTKEDVGYSNDDEKTGASLIEIAIEQSPAIPVKNADGTWGGPSSTQYQLSNPVALAHLQSHDRKKLFGMGTFYAETELLKGLSFRAELNGNINYINDYAFEPSYVIAGYIKEDNKSYRKSENNLSWTFNTMLKYNKTFGKHAINLMALHEASERTWEKMEATREGYINNIIQELDQGDVTTALNNGSKGDWAMESYLGRIYYVYNDRYIINGSVRADGSSVFGQNNRWGYFPSGSVAWRVSEEPFMQRLEKINNLKLRFEYGITGNQNSHGATYYASMKAWSTEWGTGFLAENYANPDFKWEKKATTNIGLDIGLFKNRVEIIVDAYKNKTSNLFLKVPLPNYMGTTDEGSITPPWKNIGEMENRGIGIIINTVNVQGTLTWASGFNFSLDRNKLTKLYTESSFIDQSAWFMSGFISRSVIDEPLWQFYGYETDGLFDNLDEIRNHSTQNELGRIDPVLGTWVGDIKFKELSGDTIINEKDRAFIGNPWPKFTFGFSNTLTYKRFELSFFFNGVYGNDIFNYQRLRNELPGASGPGYSYLKGAAEFAKIGYDNYGQPYLLNPGTRISRVTNDDPNGNEKPSDLFIEDGSYLRLKNIQLSYNIPSKILTKASLNNIRITASVQNVFTITRYTGLDPEIGAFVKDEYNYLFGIDYRRYPSSRVYTISVTVDF